MVKKIIHRSIIVIASVTLILSGGTLAYQSFMDYQSAKQFNEIQEKIEPPVEIIEKEKEPTQEELDQLKLDEYRKLAETNPDMVGWIKIADTNINYPVMQTPNENEYYSRRGFDKKYSGNGTPFLDIRCSLEEPTDNWMIYSHNSLDELMFSHLIKYRDYNFYQEHPIIEFDTLDELNQFEIIAVFNSQVYYQSDQVFKYYQFFDAQNEEEFNYFVENVKALSLYDTGVEAKYGDQLLTLSTCRYEVEDGRFVVVGRKVNK